MKFPVWILALALAGCTAKAPQAVLTHSAAVATAAARTFEVSVRAPKELGAGGAILTDGGVGLIRGGQILTDGGVGVDQPAKFFLADELAQVLPVGGAGVQAVAFDGTPVGGPVAADAQGTARLVDVPDGQPLTCFAAFRTGGKVYRLAAVIASGSLGGPVMLDPINTMVESRVRQLLGGKQRSEALAPDRLKRVWSICNAAGVTLAPADLEAGVAPEVAAEKLNQAWTTAINSQVTSEAEKAEIQAFVAALKAATN
jgi:hypothetical protein